jgi:hypothetical protein
LSSGEAKDLLFIVILSEAKDLLSPHPSHTWLASFSNCDTTYNLVVFCPPALHSMCQSNDSVRRRETHVID